MSSTPAFPADAVIGFSQAKLLKQFAHDQDWNKLGPQAIKEAATVLGFNQTKKEITSKHSTSSADEPVLPNTPLAALCASINPSPRIKPCF